MRRKILSFKIFSVFFLCLFLLLACGCSPGESKASGLREVKDFNGTVVALKEKPERIVSLGISVDDVLVDIVPAARIVGLTYLADNPDISNVTEKAKQVENRVQGNVESVVALKPDLVIAPSWQSPALVQSLRDVGLTVYVCISPETIAQVKDHIREVADITGEKEKGEQIIAQMDTDLNAVAAKVKTIPENERLTLLRFSTTGAGNSATLSEICRLAGVKNGAALAGIPNGQMLTKEHIIMINPDFCLLPTYAYVKTIDLNRFRKELEEDPAYQNIKAVQNKRFYNVPDRYLYAMSHYMTFAVKEVAKAAYPHLFTDK